MGNKLIDLNNMLFAQIERFSAEDMTTEKLTNEINRSRAIQLVAGTIIENARLAFDAHKAIHVDKVGNLPAMIGVLE